jgi:hypothetical protein
MHKVLLTTEELVFTIGSLIETHRRHIAIHLDQPEPGISSLPIAINSIASAYDTLNAALYVPRKETLERV